MYAHMCPYAYVYMCVLYVAMDVCTSWYMCGDWRTTFGSQHSSSPSGTRESSSISQAGTMSMLTLCSTPPAPGKSLKKKNLEKEGNMLKIARLLLD